ncbi:1-deoxy-D-xylulose 5-phosphate reductoisomerase [Desulfocucumis palustris]|uniref:1-deoxy-D-xylulose 5-phosphate reductoisomerase n=1 Tax=Desulfocucumis palustris TaxID=1898651 RepID=A0A2L2XEJ4_9FIRM|nr:1-deoxy-D-xylulose 5-phosphate reductoisomerase [Desulfocucumis palustris]
MHNFLGGVVVIKGVSILGSTGSIGCQALDVVSRYPERFFVTALAAGKNWRLLSEQAARFRPELVSVAAEKDARLLEDSLPEGYKPEIHWGEEGLMAVAACAGAGVVLTAVTGTAGLLPTVAAIKAGKDIALANKETLVAAGEPVTKLAFDKGVNILPVDSEHSAIWQCLSGRIPVSLARRATGQSGGDAGGLTGICSREVGNIILTASGGPFRREPEDLSGVTVEMALAHPNWQMGKKITIDSATLMNKGLEVIEAHWLFGVEYSRIRVLVHPQSIIHSMVEFVDGSVLAQLGLPDMRLPIQYALGYPERLSNDLPRINWFDLRALTFQAPDYSRFPLLRLAFQAGEAGGTMPAALNAANEVAVEAFLNRKINFSSIYGIVSRVVENHRLISGPDLEEILAADLESRREARKYAGLT